MPIGKYLMEAYLKTCDGNCDKKCSACLMFMKKENMCWYKLEELQKEFSKQRSLKFQEYMRGIKE